MSRQRSLLHVLLPACLALSPASFSFAQPTAGLPAPAAPSQVSVTVYSTADPASFDPQQFIAQNRMGYNPGFAWQVPGFGMVQETRPINFLQGANTLRFTNVAEFIDPTTVSFTDLQMPEATRVLEQRFLFDLVNQQKLLEKYIDQTVTVRVGRGEGKTEEITGKLLSASQHGVGLTLLTEQGVRLVSSSDIQLGQLPGGLITKPTLEWQLASNAPGQRNVRTTYQTSGITWRADYNLLLSPDDKSADLVAWVTVMNLSGASFENAQLKLIAGDVQRVQPSNPMMNRGRAMRVAQDSYGVQEPGFEEKSFFEYHLYTLPRRTNIPHNATQQITLFPTARNVGVEKVLVYYGLPEQVRYRVFPEPAQDRDLGQQSNKKVDVYVRMQNTEANKLGIPLPKGKVRVFKQDQPQPGKMGDGALEFIGEDVIDHTAKNATVLAKIGQAFDVTGERTQTNFTISPAGKMITEAIRIRLKNAKKEPQKVVIRENLYRWTNWEITQASEEYKKQDSRTIHFEVTVPPEGSKTVEYMVKYTW